MEFWGLWQNHWETVSCSSTTFWNLLPPRCFFRGLRSLWSLFAKLGLYGECSWHSHPNCYNKTAICWAVWGLGTKWLFVFLAFWRSVLVVTDAVLMLKHKKLSHSGSFVKPRILCWRHAFTHNTFWQTHKPAGWQCAKGHSLISSEKCCFKKVVEYADIYCIFLLCDSFLQFHVAYEFR